MSQPQGARGLTPDGVWIAQLGRDRRLTRSRFINPQVARCFDEAASATGIDETGSSQPDMPPRPAGRSGLAEGAVAAGPEDTVEGGGSERKRASEGSLGPVAPTPNLGLALRGLTACWRLSASLRVRTTRARAGQSITEAALLLLVVTVALVSFFSFIRNAVSSRLAIGADTFGHGLQYECENRWPWEAGCTRADATDAGSDGPIPDPNTGPLVF